MELMNLRELGNDTMVDNPVDFIKALRDFSCNKILHKSVKVYTHVLALIKKGRVQQRPTKARYWRSENEIKNIMAFSGN